MCLLARGGVHTCIICLGPEPVSHFALLPPPDPFPARGFDFRVVFGDPQEVGVELLVRLGAGLAVRARKALVLFLAASICLQSWRIIAPARAVRPCAMPAVMLRATQRRSRGGARGK